jgi:hypothetical protein
LKRTPQTHRDIEDQLDILEDPSITPLTRRLIEAKISHGFQALTAAQAESELQIQEQAGIINEYKARKKRKVAIDVNDKFVNIEQIYRAQEEAKEKEEAWQRRHPIEEARKQAEILQQGQQEAFMGVWDLKAESM